MWQLVPANTCPFVPEFAGVQSVRTADKLGVEKREIRKGFQAARKAGELEKTRDDEENTGHFKLTGQASA